jgi:uncharacterized protein YndB with AHSA1/START domain
MTVTSVDKDTSRNTMTITAEFDAPVERVWRIWEDPRQLERWWGPPTYPATFVEHELVAGGTASYYMTGPEGQRSGGWWRFVRVDPPRALEFEDGFADKDGRPNPNMPTMTNRVALTDRPEGGTLMTVVVSFASPEAMEKLMSMGMDEGMTEAMGQIDAILSAPADQ